MKREIGEIRKVFKKIEDRIIAEPPNHNDYRVGKGIANSENQVCSREGKIKTLFRKEGKRE